MSLVALADHDALPELQLMDEETLRWIKSNKPDFSVSRFEKNFIPEIRSVLSVFTPPVEWFLRPEHIDSIHGIRHIMRVMANAAYLVQKRKITDQLATKLYVAVAIHDLQRKNDKGDSGHAQRAAEWLKLNREVVLNQMGISFASSDIEDVCTAIVLHEVPYSEFGVQPDYAGETKTLVDFLKTADALDRFRLPRLKWWIKDELLVFLPPESAKLFAYKLVVASEGNFLETGKSLDSILTAVETL